MWGRGKKTVVPAKQLTSVIDGLKEVYFSKVRSNATSTILIRPRLLYTKARRATHTVRYYISGSPTSRAQGPHAILRGASCLDAESMHSCGCQRMLAIMMLRLSLPLRFSCCWSQVRPLEETYKFGSFFSPMLTESDFDAKPSVLLLGQYSTGTPPKLQGICLHRV